MTEMFNRTVLSMLGTVDSMRKSNWASHVEALSHAYNCTTHESTGYSPFFLMFMREPKIPVYVLFSRQDEATQQPQHDYSSYIEALQRQMTETFKVTMTKADKARLKQEGAYNRKVRDHELHPGHRVLVLNKTPRGRCKLKDRWEAIPYLVVRKLDGIPVYTVRQLVSRKLRTLHRNMISLCPFEVSDEEEMSNNDLLQSPSCSVDDTMQPPYEFRDDTLLQYPETADVVSPPRDFSDVDISSLNSDTSKSDDETDSSSDDSTLDTIQPRRIIRPPMRYRDVDW